MDTGKVLATLLYKTMYGSQYGIYDVAVLRVNPKDVDPSLEAIRMSPDPIVPGE